MERPREKAWLALTECKVSKKEDKNSEEGKTEWPMPVRPDFRCPSTISLILLRFCGYIGVSLSSAAVSPGWGAG